MNSIQLKYGSGSVELFPGDSAFQLEVKPPSYQIVRSDFENNLESNLNIDQTSTIGIVVSDKTRLCGYEIYLPWITEYLESKGVLSSNITFYIAYGTHPRQSDQESVSAYGETYNSYNFIHHDCDDNNSMVALGNTSSGTSVRVRRDIFEKDSLILFGAISHHYFAGYGGGRKLIFPGMAGREAIYHNHKLFIDFDSKRLDPGCQSGKLDGNPVAEDLEEIDKMMPDKLIISGILDNNGKVAILEFNNSYKQFRDTCMVYDSCYRSDINSDFDVIIASAGGYPKDINFIQSHKSLHNAASFVKDGGKLILLAECIDGIGNKTFIDIFSGSSTEIIDGLMTKYSGNGGTALATLSKTSRIDVKMLTSLSDEHCRKMGIEKQSVDQINKYLKSEKGKIGIIKNASIIF